MTHTRTGAWAQERHTHTHRRGHRGQRHMGSLNVQKLTWKQLRITNVNHNTRGHKNTRNTKCCVKMIQNDDKITTKRRFLYSFIQRLAELLAALLFMYWKALTNQLHHHCPRSRGSQRHEAMMSLSSGIREITLISTWWLTTLQNTSFWHFTLSPHHYVSSCIHGSHFSVCVSHFSLLPYDSLWFFFLSPTVLIKVRWHVLRERPEVVAIAVPLMATTPKKLLGVLTWAGKELCFPVKFKYMALTGMDFFFIWPTMPIHFFPVLIYLWALFMLVIRVTMHLFL